MKNVSNFLFILFLTVPFGIGQSASDIFIESCRNSGENSSVIRSGYTEFDCTTNRQLPSGMVQKIVDKIIASTKADADSGTISQDVLEKQLEGIQRFSRRQTGKDDAKYRYKLLFAGNDVFFAPNASVCKRYMAIEQHDGDQWQLGEFAIMNGSPNTGGGYAGFVPGAKIATIEAKVRPGDEFQRFGRMYMSSTYQRFARMYGRAGS